VSENITGDFEISHTGRMSIEQLADATNQVFAGYFVPVNFTIESYARYCRSFSLDLYQGLLARHWDGRLAGLTMLGLRGDRGWCGGFGITEEFRGKGLANWLAGKLVEHARSLGLATLQLEVLYQNTRAFQTYQKAGFQTTRELVFLSAPVSQVLDELKAIHTVQLEISEVSLEDALRTAVRLEPAQGFEPSWQRETATLHTMTGLRGFVARRGGNALAVLVYQHTPENGRISILNLTFYNESAARALLERAAVNSKILRPQREDAPEEHFYVLNEPENSELFLLLSQLGLQETNRQFEMFIGLN
jgi:ribosomal protein S18 acetylase RimI-like enzyme